MNNKASVYNIWCRFMLKPTYRKFRQKYMGQIRNKYWVQHCVKIKMIKVLLAIILHR